MHLLFQTTRPLGSETGTGDDDDVGSVGQAIQACRGQQGGSEQVGPLLQGAVTGEHNARPGARERDQGLGQGNGSAESGTAQSVPELELRDQTASCTAVRRL